MIAFILRAITISILVGWTYYNRQGLKTLIVRDFGGACVMSWKGFVNFFYGVVTFGRYFKYEGWELNSYFTYFVGTFIGFLLTALVGGILLCSFLV